MKTGSDCGSLVKTKYSAAQEVVRLLQHFKTRKIPKTPKLLCRSTTRQTVFFKRAQVGRRLPCLARRKSVLSGVLTERIARKPDG